MNDISQSPILPYIDRVIEILSIARAGLTADVDPFSEQASKVDRDRIAREQRELVVKMIRVKEQFEHKGRNVDVNDIMFVGDELATKLVSEGKAEELPSKSMSGPPPESDEENPAGADG